MYMSGFDDLSLDDLAALEMADATAFSANPGDSWLPADAPPAAKAPMFVPGDIQAMSQSAQEIAKAIAAVQIAKQKPKVTRPGPTQIIMTNGQTDWTKIAMWAAGIAVVGGLVWYFSRKSKKPGA